MEAITKPNQVLAQAKNEERNPFEPEAYQILESYGIPVPDFDIAATEKEVLEYGNRIGYPIALKVISPQIIHKSDA